MIRKNFISKFSDMQLQLLIFIIFICIGSIYASLNIEKRIEDYKLIFDFFNNKISNPIIIKADLFEFLLLSRFKILIALWIIGFILFAPYINLGVSGFFGFNFGLIFSSSLIYNGFKGFVLILLLLFPQGIIYVPIFIYLTSKNIDFSRGLYKNRKSIRSFKINSQLLLEYFLVLIICTVFVLIGITLEAYINPEIIKWYISTIKY